MIIFHPSHPKGSSAEHFITTVNGEPYHLSDATVGEDVARVNQAVQHLGRLLDQVALVRVVFQLLVWQGHSETKCFLLKPQTKEEISDQL